MNISQHQRLPLLYLLCALGMCSLSCQPEKEEAVDPSPNADAIEVSSTHYRIPLNGQSQLVWQARTDFDWLVTSETQFYVDGQPMADNIFQPSTTGTFSITGRYKDLESPPVTVTVERPRNRKVLIESFTSSYCAWCPWVGHRVDSLTHHNEQVIGYSIHSQDSFQINAALLLQEQLAVYARPALRINRGYVRNFFTPTELAPLMDSIHYLLSFQPKLELSIHSELSANTLSASVQGKFYEPIADEAYLSVFLVEDKLTSTQANAFAGGWEAACPYTNAPNPIPDYENHHVLRQVLTAPLGDPIDTGGLSEGEILEIGAFSTAVDKVTNLEEAWLIAFVHGRRDDIELSHVHNAQIVQAGKSVDFEE